MLLDIYQHNKTLKLIERLLQIEKRATTNAENDISLAITLF